MFYERSYQGDRVCIYLPMIPELAVSILACARIGAIRCFAGFSAPVATE
jgi:acetyl-CoA synthetase